MPLSYRDFVHLRLSAGLTQGELADKIALARTAISKIEHGGRDLTFDESSRWANACGASVALIDAQRDVGLAYLGSLSGRRLDLALRVIALLRRLEDPHLVTLELIVEGWEKLDSSQNSDVANGSLASRRIVKKV